jgi:DMSO/TMAO reductase YedYZ molybdopterin-dependent catalytic subunit
MRIERTLRELFHSDPERADAIVFGRRVGPSRRGFLSGLAQTAMGVAVGGPIVFAGTMPAGLIPAALAQEGRRKGRLQLPGKDPNLILLSERPLVVETPEALLDEDTTPTSRFFIRNNGDPPQVSRPDGWQISIDGEVNKPLELTLGELKAKARAVTRRLLLECAGNGRSSFVPRAEGEPWANGGAGCAEWTGARLADVIRATGLKPSASFSAHYGADVDPSGDPTKIVLSRGVPIRKLMDENNLIAWEMNGKPLEPMHGFPVRLIIPGWPGSLSAKWLTRIWLRDKVHDGVGMGGTSYRIPVKPMLPGSAADAKTFTDLQSMPVRAIITSPADGTRLGANTREIKLRGAAWAGDYAVRSVDVSIDFGASWQRTTLGPPKNRYDWQRWTAQLKLPSDGYFEIWSRATDQRGIMQPHVAGNWNPEGYGANPMHRIAVLVG